MEEHMGRLGQLAANIRNFRTTSFSIVSRTGAQCERNTTFSALNASLVVNVFKKIKLTSQLAGFYSCWLVTL